MPELYLAGGCFWGAEKYLASIPGVTRTEVGYANGNTPRPTYEEVCRGDTGHAEAVRVVYDPNFLSLDFLLELFYQAIDPLSVNRQGNDVGTQYRTGIYYVQPEDLPVIQRSLHRLQARHSRPIAIEVVPLSNFTPAEEYHQSYLDKNPGGYCHIRRDLFERAAQARVNPGVYQPPEEGKLQETLTPLQYAVTRQNATEPPSETSFTTTKPPESMWISPPENPCFPPGTSLTRAAVGPALSGPWIPP